ncbi:MAG: HDOD domain-containing protein [Phycisphaerales bacterium]|nr:HDOD domain-containing protein [Phycisphaerales bacterium]
MNHALLDQMLRSPRLPSLPTIALEVIDLVQQRDVNIRQIADTISHDPALAGKILKTVNSTFYGQTKTISTITHALVILGLNAVRTLALGFSLVHISRKPTTGILTIWRTGNVVCSQP